jgi:hypothetical protein
MNPLIRSELGDSLAEHLSEKHMHIHRGALWVSFKGTPYLCLFGNDNYENPRTKAYVQNLLVCNWLEESPNKDTAHVQPVFGLSNSPTPTWAIGSNLIKFGTKWRASDRQFILEGMSNLVWSCWNDALKLNEMSEDERAQKDVNDLCVKAGVPTDGVAANFLQALSNARNAAG